MELAGQRRRTRVTYNVTVRVDEREEWAQILNESWRVMKYRFYDAEDARPRLERHPADATSRCSSTSARTRTSTISPTR